MVGARSGDGEWRRREGDEEGTGDKGGRESE